MRAQLGPNPWQKVGTRSPREPAKVAPGTCQGRCKVAALRAALRLPSPCPDSALKFARGRQAASFQIITKYSPSPPPTISPPLACASFAKPPKKWRLMAKRRKPEGGPFPTEGPAPKAANGGHNKTPEIRRADCERCARREGGFARPQGGTRREDGESAKASGASPAHGGASRDNRTHEPSTKKRRQPEREGAKARERAPVPSTKRPPP